jgi:hypothetical protein
MPKNARTKIYGERRFDVAAGTLWNSLPASLRNEQSLYSNSLYWHRNLNGNQWRTTSVGVICSYFFLRVTSLAAVFWTRWSLDTIEAFTPIKQLLSLPTRCPDPAVYILTGILPIEAQIHLKALVFYNNVHFLYKCFYY